jgi:hypothetical protein
VGREAPPVREERSPPPELLPIVRVVQNKKIIAGAFFSHYTPTIGQSRPDIFFD